MDTNKKDHFGNSIHIENKVIYARPIWKNGKMVYYICYVVGHTDKYIRLYDPDKRQRFTVNPKNVVRI